MHWHIQNANFETKWKNKVSDNNKEKLRQTTFNTFFYLRTH